MSVVKAKKPSKSEIERRNAKRSCVLFFKERPGTRISTLKQFFYSFLAFFYILRSITPSVAFMRFLERTYATLNSPVNYDIIFKTSIYDLYIRISRIFILDAYKSKNILYFLYFSFEYFRLAFSQISSLI